MLSPYSSEEVQGKDSEEASQVTVWLLMPSDQIRCDIGKGGQTIQSIRSESGVQIHILKDDHLPSCALSSDELVQVIWSNLVAIFIILLVQLHCSFFNC